VHLNGLVHAPCGLLTRVAGGHATGKIGRVSRVVAARPLDNNEKTVHRALPSLRPSNARLLEHAVERPGGKIVAWVPRYCNAPRLVGMLELAMAALGRDKEPAVLLNQPDDVSDLH
jgi:hypothetical protein